MTKSSKNTRDRSAEIQKVLGKAFWSIVEHYKLNQREQAVLLGINYNRTRLSSFKEGFSIPDDPDKVLRASHLVGIHKSLRILFPHNRKVVYGWLKTPRKQFNNKSAMDYIEVGGPDYESLMRLASVRRFLDQVRVSG